MLEKIDHSPLLFLNSFLGDNDLWNGVIAGFATNSIVRGFPIFFTLVALWFYSDNSKSRARIFAGLFATLFAVAIAVSLQHNLYIHTRPVLDETLHLKLYDPAIVTGWDRLNSFPSDTATLFFSLSAVIFIESPLVGSMALLWSLFTAGLMR